MAQTRTQHEARLEKKCSCKYVIFSGPRRLTWFTTSILAAHSLLMIRGSEGRREGGDSPATARGGRGGGRLGGRADCVTTGYGGGEEKGGGARSCDVTGANRREGGTDASVQWLRSFNSRGRWGLGGGVCSRRLVMMLVEESDHCAGAGDCGVHALLD